MKLYLDVNIVVDLTTNRLPWSLDAARLIELHRRGQIEVACAALTFPHAYYWMKKRQIEQGESIDILSRLLQAVIILPATADRIGGALANPLPDLEDAVQYELAAYWQADGIVTRDRKDFRGLPIPARSADRWLQAFVGTNKQA